MQINGEKFGGMINSKYLCSVIKEIIINNELINSIFKK